MVQYLDNEAFLGKSSLMKCHFILVFMHNVEVCTSISVTPCIYIYIYISTTPLRSGLVPLAPVGPHELSSFISGLSWAHETNVEVYAMEDRRMHVKHLNKGVSGFVDNALQ